MEKRLILRRLTATIKKLEQLKPTQFNYARYITEHDSGCGTVCCVAGWYPQWFPNTGFEYFKDYGYTENHKLTIGYGPKRGRVAYHNISPHLEAYHGLDEDIIGFLFYGGDELSVDIEAKHLIPEKFIHYIDNECITLQMPCGMQSTLHEVLAGFKLVHQLVESNYI